MTDENARADGSGTAPPPGRSSAPQSRSDPMAVPATAPLWTYQHDFAPSPLREDGPIGEPATENEAVRPRAAGRDAARGTRGRRRRGRALGFSSLLLAIGAAWVQVAAVSVATGGDFSGGTVLAIVAIAASVGAVLTGLVAVIVRAGRALGVAGVLLGIVANPFVLLTVFEFVADAASID